ncbi:hypothetical protein BST61_g672 [Cercospora zeina]
MFCLRQFIPILLFLLNAPPIYALLFLSAYFIIQRPCVYCSILLFVLVGSIFDFSSTDWFEPRWHANTSALSESAAAYLSGNATLTEVVSETAGLFVSALNGTGGSLTSVALDSVKRRVEGSAAPPSIASTPNGINAFEWIRNILDKRHVRIQCLGVVVRI